MKLSDKLDALDRRVALREIRETPPAPPPPPPPPEADEDQLSSEQQRFIDRARAMYGTAKVFTGKYGAVVVEAPGFTPIHDTPRIWRVTRDGKSAKYMTVEQALTRAVQDRHGDQAKEARHANTMECIADSLIYQLHVPADHRRWHAHRGEYEPGFEPVFTTCEQTLRDAQDPAERDYVDDIVVLLKRLPQRQREIIALRFGLFGTDPMTLEQLGVRFNVTRERIRQIESFTLKQLRLMSEEEGPFVEPVAASKERPKNHKPQVWHLARQGDRYSFELTPRAMTVIDACLSDGVDWNTGWENAGELLGVPVKILQESYLV